MLGPRFRDLPALGSFSFEDFGGSNVAIELTECWVDPLASWGSGSDELGCMPPGNKIPPPKKNWPRNPQIAAAAVGYL